MPNDKDNLITHRDIKQVLKHQYVQFHIIQIDIIQVQRTYILLIVHYVTKLCLSNIWVGQA